MALATTQSLDKKHALETISGILHLFSSFGNPSYRIERPLLEKYFTPQLEIISNDKTVSHNLNEFLTRFQRIQKKYKSITYSPLLEEPIVSQNKATIRYNANVVTTSDQKQIFNIIAILTFQESKISHWTEVLHEQGTGHFDS